jgi:hypothetical protein
MGLTWQQQLDVAITQIRCESREAGFEAGIAVAEKIIDWLNVQPPRKWAQQIRAWGQAEIDKARKQMS